MASFDVNGARQAGYSDTEIAEFLGQRDSFDVKGARAGGYSDMEIVGFLTQPKAPPLPAPPGAERTGVPGIKAPPLPQDLGGPPPTQPVVAPGVQVLGRTPRPPAVPDYLATEGVTGMTPPPVGPRPGIVGALSEGVDQAKGMVGAGLEAVGNAASSGAPRGMQPAFQRVVQAGEALNRPQEYAPRASFKDVVDNPSMGGAAQWAAESAAQAIPNIAATVGAGLVGGPIAGAGLSYLMNAGENYEDWRAKGIEAAPAALAAAIPQTALDYLEPMRIIAKMRGTPLKEAIKQSFLKRMARATGEGLLESTTEGAQKGVGIATEAMVTGKMPDPHEALWEMVNEGAAAFLPGAAGGGLQQVAEARHARSAPPAPLPPPVDQYAPVPTLDEAPPPPPKRPRAPVQQQAAPPPVVQQPAPPVDPAQLYQDVKTYIAGEAQVGISAIVRKFGVHRDDARAMLDQAAGEGLLIPKEINGGASVVYVNAEKKAARGGKSIVHKAPKFTQQPAAAAVQQQEEVVPAVEQEQPEQLAPPQPVENEIDGRYQPPAPPPEDSQQSAEDAQPRIEEVEQPGPVTVQQDQPPQVSEQTQRKEGDNHAAGHAAVEQQAQPAVEEKQPDEGATKHEYSSTQVNLPEQLAKPIREAAARIPDADLAADGRENEPHVTVKYGLHGEKADEVAKLLADEPPIKVKLGEVSKFPEKDGRGFEVVKFDVDSPDLHRLNKKIADALPHTDTFPDYHPHVTLAYVKPGTADKYVGRHPLTGQEVTLDHITFSSKTGEKVDVPLGGKTKTSRSLTVNEGPKQEVITPGSIADRLADISVGERQRVAEHLQDGETVRDAIALAIYGVQYSDLRSSPVDGAWVRELEKKAAVERDTSPEQLDEDEALDAVAAAEIGPLVSGLVSDGHKKTKQVAETEPGDVPSLDEVRAPQSARRRVALPMDVPDKLVKTLEDAIEAGIIKPRHYHEDRHWIDADDGSAVELIQRDTPQGKVLSFGAWQDPRGVGYGGSTAAPGQITRTLRQALKNPNPKPDGVRLGGGPEFRAKQKEWINKASSTTDVEKPSTKVETGPAEVETLDRPEPVTTKTQAPAEDLEAQQPGPVETLDTAETREQSDGGDDDSRTGPVGSGHPQALESPPAKDVRSPRTKGPARKGSVRGPGDDARRGDGSEREAEPGLGASDAGSPGGVGVSAGRSDAAGTERKPRRVDRAKSERDFRLTDDTVADLGGKVQRFEANLAAIELVKKLEDEDRLPTAAEAKVLARYVGWGGLAQEAFTYQHDTRGRDRQERLQKALTEAEYQAARASTKNAHYTSLPVVRQIWRGLERLGVKKGMRILEPSMGTGNFFGAQPEGTLPAWRHGVELDAVTARIAKKLYPDANVIHSGYQEAGFPDNYFDVAVSNVPFGKITVSDPAFKRQPALTSGIHNYFFAKALAHVKPGGIVAFVTSRYTMDSVSSSVREALAEKADLIGAVRLPGGKTGAFANNAGTEVTTDIIFLRKRRAGEKAAGAAWVKTEGQTTRTGGGDEDVYALNEYFVKHPEQMLGEMENTGSQYRSGEMTLAGAFDEKALEAAIERLPEGVLNTSADSSVKAFDPIALTQDTVKIKAGGFGIDKGKLVRREGNGIVPVEVKEPVAKRIRGMMGIRDAVKEVYRTQLADKSDAEVNTARRALNKAYDSFVAEHGPIASRPNASAFGLDPEYPLIRAIEDFDRDSGAAKKRDVFSKRTIQAYKPIEKTDAATDALSVTLAERGFPDWTRMESLTGKDKDALIEELGDQVYENPAGEQWELADEYLSGDVRKKLREAEQSAKSEPSRFQRNVEALNKVQPAPLTHEEISVRPGVSWIPVQDVKRFIAERVFGDGSYASEFRVDYSHAAAVWAVIVPQGVRNASTNAKFNPHFFAHELMEMALNSKKPKVFVEDADGKKTLNTEATLKAEDAQDRIVKDFEKWVWADEKRRDRLVKTYNDEFNGVRLWEPDGKHLLFPGMARQMLRGGDLDAHQKNAVWRMIRAGNTLLAHVVGAGKTFEMIAAGMEMKRMGLVQKPMYVVPNHLVEQWGDDFLKLYPNANVYIAGKETFATGKRQETAACIAAGNFDAVILSHKSFEALPVSLATFKEFIEKETAEIREELSRLRQGTNDKDRKGGTVKRLETQLESLTEKLKQRSKTEAKDKAIEFESLGVDHLFVDEAHMYKNLGYVSSMDRIAGLPNTNSNRAFDMLMKTQYLSTRQDNRGVVFATGTPVANSMAEMYTMMRYLALPYLRQHGIDKFDAWARQYGRAARAVEVAPEGGKFRMNTRFVEFVNVPELITGFRGVADVKSAEDLNLPRPVLEGGKPATIVNPSHPLLRALVRDLGKRAAAIRGGKVDPKDDNMLKITFEGRTAALDLRLRAREAYIAAEGIQGDAITARDTVSNLEKAPKDETPAAHKKRLADLAVARKELAQLRELAIDVEPYLSDRSKLTEETGGKVTMVADSVAAIYKETAEEKSTQVVFMDLGTPKDKSAKRLAKEEVSDNPDALDDDDEAPAEEAALIESGYKDLRTKLIARGVKEGEIAFIHQAKTDGQKQDLFRKVNEGTIRVLIGSTEKMGAGTNVQRRLKALHHVDVPWRPADIEQREGRILRQGNTNASVRIFQYVSEGSFDAYMWQGIANKAKMISRAMSGDLTTRSVADLSSQVLSAKEAIALSSGDPVVQERMELEAKVGQLRRQKRNALDAKREYESSLENLKRRVTVNKAIAEHAKAAEAKHDEWAAAHPEEKAQSFTGVAAEDLTGETLATAINKKGDGATVGHLGPFPIELSHSWRGFELEVKDGVADFKSPIWKDALDADGGSVTLGRLTSYWKSFSERAKSYGWSRDNSASDLNKFEKSSPAPFAKEDELTAGEKRLDEITTELGLMEDAAPVAEEEPTAKKNGGAPTPFSAGFMGTQAIAHYATRAVQHLAGVVRARMAANPVNTANLPHYTPHDPDVKKAMDAARVEKEASGVEKFKDAVKAFGHAFSRQYRHLPHGARYAEFIVKLNQLLKAKGIAIDRAGQAIIDQIASLTKDEFSDFLYVVAFDDMAARIKQQEAEGTPVEDADLPFEFKTRADFNRARKEARSIAAQNPKVVQAIRLRKAMWGQVKPLYIEAMADIGEDVSGALKREDYFRHRVHKYLELQNALGQGGTGAGGPVKTPVGRGWLKKAVVNAHSYSLDYVRAEFEVLEQMMEDTQKAKFIGYILDPKNDLNIVPELRQKAAAHNKAVIMPHFARVARQFNQKNPGAKRMTAESMYRRIMNSRQAMAMGKLEALASRGSLASAPPHLQKTIRSLAAGKASIIDVMPLANWLVNDGQNTAGVKASLLLFKGLAEKKRITRKLAKKKYIGTLARAYAEFATTTHVIGQPHEGQYFYLGRTIDDKVAEAIEAAGVGQVKADAIKKARIVGGPRTQWVIPREVQQTLTDSMSKSAGPLASVDRVFSAALTGWKKLKLIHPFTFIAYNLRNMSGDAWRVLEVAPRAFGNAKRAFGLIVDYKRTGKLPAGAFKAWFERGGMDQNLQVAEMGDVNKLEKLKHLLIDPDASFSTKSARAVATAWNKTWGATRTFTDVREAILRLAMFMEFQRQLKDGNGTPKTFGASLREEVMALKDMDDRAYKLANDAMLAYDEVSHAGGIIRRVLIPFWSFQEQNARAYSRLIRNAVIDGRKSAAVGLAAAAGIKGAANIGAWTAIRLGQTVGMALGLKTLVTLFNMAVMGDDEDDLPESTKKDTHFILGRDENGKVRTFNRIGLVDDLLEWAGLNAAPFYVREYLNGRMTLDEMSEEMVFHIGPVPVPLKPAVNKVWQSITPVLKIPVDVIGHVKTYPDVFNPRAMRDTGEYIARELNLVWAYRKVIGRPQEKLSSETLLDMVIHRYDPKETKYNDFKYTRVPRWAASNEATVTGGGSNFKANRAADALRNIRESIRYEDTDALRKGMEAYTAAGGNKRNLKASIDRLHPLGGFQNKADRKRYQESLGPKETAELEQAIMFWEEHYNSQRSELEDAADDAGMPAKKKRRSR